MGKDYIMARKPNPAFLAEDTLAEDAIRQEIRETLDACAKQYADGIHFKGYYHGSKRPVPTYPMVRDRKIGDRIASGGENGAWRILLFCMYRL